MKKKGHNYTIIKINKENKLEPYELENLEDLYNIADINEDTLIVEGNTKVKALKDDSETYAKYYGDFRAGLKAEIEFYKMMSDNKYFIERIDQSKESIQKYIDTAHEKYSFIKRPDFVLLDKNICFEIKCTKKYNNGIYYFNKEEAEGLKNFQEKTNKKIYLAIYEKKDDNFVVCDGNAKFFIIELDKVCNFKTKNTNRSISYEIYETKNTNIKDFF